MTDRERLFELVAKVQDGGFDLTDVVAMRYTTNELLIDYLLANGVTFAKDTNVLTNGDRVRAMNDEELAEWNHFCPYPTDECTLKGCTNCIRAWLKQPAPKEDDNG